MNEEKKERPQDRWNKKNGYVAKSFRMHQSLVDEFKAACDKAGVSQSSVIVAAMRRFIEEHK